MYFEYSGTRLRIMGSMHIFPAGSEGLPAWVSQAFKWSDAIVFESDPPSLLPYFRGASMNRLERDLSPRAWNVLQKIWRSSGHIPPLGEVRPWAAMLIASAFTLHTSEGVEPNLIPMALDQGKPISYLETAADVAAAFESAPLEDVLAGLEILTENLMAPQRTLVNMHGAWLRRDLSGLYSAAMQSPVFQRERIRDAVLARRNRAWAPLIKEHLSASQNTLVVVGALHLCGGGNVLECVGENVEPVRSGG